jgi:hypothetical protein
VKRARSDASGPLHVFVGFFGGQLSDLDELLLPARQQLIKIF